MYDEAVGDEQVLLEVAVAWGSNIKVCVEVLRFVEGVQPQFSPSVDSIL